MALLGTDTKVTGPVPAGVLLLETFQGKEALGTPYRYDLTLLSERSNIPVRDVLGHSLTIHIKLDNGETRCFNGIVTYFAKTGMAMRHTRYVAVLCPKLSLFDYTRDCRILFDGNVPKHVTDLLGKRGYSDVDAGGLQGTYREREYTVQYRESDLNFVQRLLEEEGIYYYFKHADDKHQMVLGDSAGAHAPVSGYETILYMPRQRKQAREEEHFWSLSVAGALYPGKFSVLRGYDHLQARPKRPQIVEKLSPETEPGSGFEDYDYPGGLTEEPAADAWGQTSLDEAHAATTLVTVEGNTMGLGAGDLLKLRRPRAIADDFNPFWSDGDFEKEYLITSATYFISINQYETGDVAESDEPFRATFTLLDSQAPYRPASTATKPRIEGPQTALVVGPAGEEIYTDKLGRVKVQFDWDRVGQRDEDSSIWVRVAQVWAGKQWGAMHLPRIGHEVIVSFLDGDPDRPIVTGRVYNQDNLPPYTLPDNKTQSGLKSRSSKGGTADNFNEIRFEDLKGQEELHVQAEKDMSTLVKHDQSNTINANQTDTVGADRTSTIHGYDTLMVDKDRKVTVKGNLVTTVEGGGGGPVMCNHSVTGTHLMHASDKVQIDAPTQVVVMNDENTVIGLASRKIKIHAPDEIELKVGGTSIKIEPSKITLEAAGHGKIEITADIEAKSNGQSKLKLDGDATLHGNANATVEAATAAKLAGGGAAGGNVIADGSGVAANGSQVKLNG
jgi:type VI secretion system secreted protein VgrG